MPTVGFAFNLAQPPAYPAQTYRNTASMTQPLYTLHYTPDSAAMILRLALRQTGAPFAETLIDRPAGALDSPAYRAMQPLGKIPAMETPDGPMFETAAMLLYLADRHSGMAPAPDSPQRAAFLSWLFFTSTNIHPTLLQVFYPERIGGKASADAVLTQAAATLKSHFALLDQMVARNHPTWLSAQPGVLGFYVGVLLRWLAGFAPDHPAYLTTADLPALGPILAALETCPAARAVAGAEACAPTIFTNPY